MSENSEESDNIDSGLGGRHRQVKINMENDEMKLSSSAPPSRFSSTDSSSSSPYSPLNSPVSFSRSFIAYPLQQLVSPIPLARLSSEMKMEDEGVRRRQTHRLKSKAINELGLGRQNFGSRWNFERDGKDRFNV